MAQSKSSALQSIIYCFAVSALFAGCSERNRDEPAAVVSETIVVNLSQDTYDEYIGRGINYHTHMLADGIKPGAEGWLGNPHPIGWCDRCLEYHTREECIEAFKIDFYQKLETESAFRQHVISLRGKRLGCYCKPEACHGDIIKAWIDANSGRPA